MLHLLVRVNIPEKNGRKSDIQNHRREFPCRKYGSKRDAAK